MEPACTACECKQKQHGSQKMHLYQHDVFPIGSVYARRGGAEKDRPSNKTDCIKSSKSGSRKSAEEPRSVHDRREIRTFTFSDTRGNRKIVGSTEQELEQK